MANPKKSAEGIRKPHENASILPEKEKVRQTSRAALFSRGAVRSESKDEREEAAPQKEEHVSSPHSSFLEPRSSLSREETKVREASSLKKFFFLGLGGIFLLIGIPALLMSTIFVRLTVTVEPKKESIPLNAIAISVDANVSRVMADERTIPGEYLEFSERVTQEFPATANASLEEHAKGRVRISNAFSTATQGIVAHSRFVTDAGLIFRLVNPITIPGAEIREGKIVPNAIEADLVADGAGQEYNIPKNTMLRIAGFQGTQKYEGFYAVALDTFSGGFKGEGRVASKEDIITAEEEVTKKVYEKLAGEVKEKTPPGFLFLDGLKQIEIKGVNVPAEHTRLDRFSAEADAMAKIIVFQKDDIFEVLKTNVLKSDAAEEFIKDSAAFDYRIQAVDFKKKQATIALQGTIKAQKTFSSDALAADLAGKKEGTLIAMLKSRKEFESSRLSFFPPWIFSAPSDPKKIKFMVK